MLEFVVNCGVVTTASGMDATVPGNDGLCFLEGGDSVATREVAAFATDMGFNISSGAACFFLLGVVITTLVLCFCFIVYSGSKSVVSAAIAFSFVACDKWVALASLVCVCS